MRAPNRTVVDGRAFGQAMARMKAFLPMENWPEPMVKLFFGSRTLSYAERLRLLTFLVGNGYPVDAVCTVLAKRMRTSASAMHANNVLKDIASGRYDHKWYYFNVNQQDYLYLNNRPYGEPSGNQIFTRRMNAWDRHCWTHPHYPTLKQQQEVVGM